MIRRVFSSLLLTSSCSITLAGSPPDDDIEHSFGTSEAVTLATGYTQALFEAPATATVLNSADLRALGARSLHDALDLVPGYLVSTGDGRDTVTTVRGITSRTLILVDGVPVPGTLLQPYQSLDNLLLHNVQRLEIVRGPASSIYGADAVAGVINIITKTAAHDGNEVGVSGGSFNTYEAWYLQAFKVREADVSVYVGGRSTDWTKEIVRADGQSVLDIRFGTHASNAPAVLPSHRDLLEARVDAVLGAWTFRAHYLDVYNWQTAFTYAISERSTADTRLFGGTVLHKAALSAIWELSSFIDYGRTDQPADGEIYPPGAFGGAFPDGVLTAYDIGNARIRAETAALFSGWNRHTLRFGGGAQRSEFRINQEDRNFIIRGGQLIPTGIFGPRGGVNDAPGLPDVNQDNYYLYVQDQWAIANDWNITAGARADYYTEIGTTINPRLAVVWNARQDLTFKMLYGRAFRPPTVFESHSEGVYTAKGNPNINPTTLDSIEASGNFRTAKMSTTLTTFWYQQDDLIQIVSDSTSPRGTAYTNRGTETGDGAEIEITVELPFRLRLHGGYAYQERHGASVKDNVNLRFNARHSVNVDLMWQPTREWSAGLTSLSLLGRQRAASDTREPASGYMLVNASITRRNVAETVDISLAVRNLFDKEASTQSESPTSAPYDIPLPGRGLFIEAVAHW